jgi:hypothetical protein
VEPRFGPTPFAHDQSKNPPPRNRLDRVPCRFARPSYFAAVGAGGTWGGVPARRIPREEMDLFKEGIRGVRTVELP